ncbi:MAG: AAA family ATPase [Polyangiales bacterium]
MSGTGVDAEIAAFQADALALRESLARRLVGQEGVVEEVLIGFFAGGHVLLEGAPGLGKTLLVRTLADATSLRFSRIQFTPDLMPSDVLGTHVVVDDAGRKRFELQKGPIFGQIVLADEINRATPKTQSALLEAMAERSVTLSGERHELEAPFFVLATENPIEMEGTYPLPEAQLDRFLLKVLVPSPDEDTLVRILERTTGTVDAAPTRVLDGPRILAMQRRVREVHVTDSLARWVARLVRASEPDAPEATRTAKKYLRYGAGVRGAQSLVLAAKAHALLQGRSHVASSDLRRVALPTLRHRLVRSFEAESDGVTNDAIVEGVLAEVPELPASVSTLLRA